MPGGIPGTIVAAAGPIALLVVALVKSSGDKLLGISAFHLGAAIAAMGVVVYFLANLTKRD